MRVWVSATRTVPRGEARRALWLAVAIAITAMSVWGAVACGDGGQQNGTEQTDMDLEVAVGETAPVRGVEITVRAFQSAFQPVSPAQKLSDDTLVAPAAGESFYQAYVRIENKGSMPVRADPEDFVCRIGSVVTTLEPTRSGPMPRSLISGTSLDLVVTFRGRAGLEPVLIYDPPWYDGLVYFSTAFAGGSFTTTTQGEQSESTTTEASGQ